MASRTIAVQRFNAEVDREAFWQSYTVEISDSRTVLDALLVIADTIDPTLAFRRTCRSGICGSCAATVNGRSCLLCQLSIAEAAGAGADAPIRVEPLRGFRVLRDLVVDMDPFFEQFDRAGAWLIPDPAYDGLLSAEISGRLWPAMSCVMCGICSRGQDEGSLAHPAAVSRVLSLAHDPRDAHGRARLSGLDERPDREFAERLRTVCPKGVDVRGLVE